MAQVDSENTIALPSRPVGAAEASPEELSARLAKQERERQKALRRVTKLRERAGNEIERLLSFLDASDAYASTELESSIDDEPHDDNELEPSLCGVTASTGSGEDLELDTCDDEPSLGSVEDHPNGYRDASDYGYGNNQERWAAGNYDDREEVCEDEGAEHDGAEPDEDREPSLGWTVDGVIGNTSGLDCDAEQDGEAVS